MSAELQERVGEWLRRTPSVRGTLVRGVRFADGTFLCDFDSRDFPTVTLEEAWRMVTDTFQVLAAHERSAARLVWTYERASLHSVCRPGDTVFGVFVSRTPGEVDLDALNRLMEDFQLLDLAQT